MIDNKGFLKYDIVLVIDKVCARLLSQSILIRVA